MTFDKKAVRLAHGWSTRQLSEVPIFKVSGHLANLLLDSPHPIFDSLHARPRFNQYNRVLSEDEQPNKSD